MKARGSNLVLVLPLMLGGCASGLLPSLGLSTTPPPRQAAAPPAQLLTAQNESLLYLNVVDGLVKQERYGAALGFLDGYAVKETSLSDRYWLLRGDALLGVSRYAEAAAAFTRLDMTALAADGWNGQGRVAAGQHQWAGAADYFRKAALAQPANADFLNNQAFAQMRDGGAAAAVPVLRQAHELAPGSDLIRDNLIIALKLSGDIQGADALLAGVADSAQRRKIATTLDGLIRNNALTADGPAKDEKS